MRRSYRVLASALTAAVLLGAAACAQRGGGGAAGHRTSPADRVSPADPPSAASTVPALTDAGAASALLRAGDLGGSWAGTEGAATWRDGLLKGKADRPECQELLDGVYAEDLLGEPSGGSAVAGFDDGEYGAQLRHHVGQYKETAVDAKLGQVRELTDECAAFGVAVAGGRTTHAVEVAPFDLPGAGDARQGLRMTVEGGVEGEEGPLTLDVAAVRVGDGAAFLTHGGLYGVDGDTTRRAVERGAQRLKEAQEARRTGRSPEAEEGESPGDQEGPREPESPAAGESTGDQERNEQEQEQQQGGQDRQDEQPADQFDAQEGDDWQDDWQDGWRSGLQGGQDE
ncbi:hypothetical protein GCM10010145_63440 [Streptomyces ruber]|uniref:Lipoprotein n=2 Tax=Streptomyces TaxID=1883 RepID=A0A918BQH8_9ACTN|nr:hypothetical protein [Streptomyces ruber]GGQ85146.1 hypothetical protein GCM10010145_63440 [Streptomyces ruber]